MTFVSHERIRSSERQTPRLVPIPCKPVFQRVGGRHSGRRVHGGRRGVGTGGSSSPAVGSHEHRTGSLAGALPSMLATAIADIPGCQSCRRTAPGLDRCPRSTLRSSVAKRPEGDRIAPGCMRAGGRIGLNRRRRPEDVAVWEATRGQRAAVGGGRMAWRAAAETVGFSGEQPPGAGQRAAQKRLDPEGPGRQERVIARCGRDRGSRLRFCPSTVHPRLCPLPPPAHPPTIPFSDGQNLALPAPAMPPPPPRRSAASSSQPASANGKRKPAAAPPPAPPSQSAKKPRFNSNLRDARSILTQPASAAFANGELDVDKFVKAREFEILALEKGMRDAKKARHRRAFQEVPRELRRRTAAHNAKRVPARLRPRAVREMVEDNTPTVNSKTKVLTPRMRLRLETAKKLNKLNRNARQKKKKDKSTDDDRMEVTVIQNKSESDLPAQAPAAQDRIKSRLPRPKTVASLKNPPIPPSKFRKRQIHKSWLPTHIFHTKRAHMTPASAPLWRFAIPLSPTQKCYRPVHRASQTRGAVAWDTSYMSTIGLQGVDQSLCGLLSALGVGTGSEKLWGNQRHAKRWRAGTRTWEGWVYERDSDHTRPIAPVTIIWCAEAQQENDITMQDANDTAGPTKKRKRKVMIRVHPSAFLQLWEEVSKLSRIQRPAVTVEDLRFEIGSIEILGPSSTEALAGVLQPVQSEVESSAGSKLDTPAKIFKHLASISNLSSLPKNILLAFSISDPRLHHPPRPVQGISSASPISTQEDLQRLLVEWPLDSTQTVPALFSRQERLSASRSLPSQKAINRRKSEAKPGQYPPAIPTDPRIPVMLFVSKVGAEAKWTVTVPWKAVSPIWNYLMHQPLSTGGTPLFGGVNETRQITFEAGLPWFPGDYPGTKAGRAWEEMEKKNRLTKWEAHPKGKRVSWETLDFGNGRRGEIGNGWACDWQYLLSRDPQGQTSNIISGEERDKPDVTAVSGTEDLEKRRTRHDDSTLIQPRHVPASMARQLLQDKSTAEITQASNNSAISIAKVTLITRGVPEPCARIYQLPVDSSVKMWLSLLPSAETPLAQRDHIRHAKGFEKNTPTAVAAMLLYPHQIPAGTKEYPTVPSEEDLIGFITTGAFNLSEGRSTGIGSIALHRVLQERTVGEYSGNKMLKIPGHGTVQARQLCIVRNAGESLGRLARWELV